MSRWNRLQKRHRKMTAQDIRNGGMPDSWLCIDCGFDTAPGSDGAEDAARSMTETGRAAFYVGWESEVYHVHAHVWKAAGMEYSGGCLSVGCLEKRLARRLSPDDFARSCACRPRRGY
jgi:hypothetical protein